MATDSEKLPRTKDEYLETFKRFLKAKQQKYTSGRREVIDVLFESSEHLEAEDILLKIRGRGKRVSRATIYRTLALLVEAGLLRTVSLEHRHTHYEKVLQGQGHDHLVCLECGKVIEFSEDLSLRLETMVCQIYGYKPVRRHFEIVGICSPCQKNRE
jgi:Fur family transcriptional regulator, ferric uptake regulator